MYKAILILASNTPKSSLPNHVTSQKKKQNKLNE